MYSSLIGPFEISIDITNQCNLRCLHCYNNSGSNIFMKDELSDDEIIDLVTEIIKIKPLNVCLTGGEPLLKKDLVYKVISMLSTNHISTSMVSNGTLLDYETAESLKNYGLSKIQLSLDGLERSHDKLRNKNGVFKSVIRALNILKEMNIDTDIGFVPTQWNIEDFDEIINIALENEVTSVRSQFFMPTGRGEANLDEVIPNKLDYRRLIRKINSFRNKINQYGLSLRIEWDDPIQHFIDVCEGESLYPQVHIKANGNIALTPYLPVTFGNVRDKRLGDFIEDGLLSAIANENFMDICRKIRCIDDMKLEGLNLPLNFMENDIYIKI